MADNDKNKIGPFGPQLAAAGQNLDEADAEVNLPPQQAVREPNLSSENDILTNREEIDFDNKLDGRLVVVKEETVEDDATLQRLDAKKKINARWFREMNLVALSTSIIVAAFIVACFQLASGAEEAQNWGRQVINTLVGFAAGAVWQKSKGNE